MRRESRCGKWVDLKRRTKMALITKLVNPTPFDVEIPYEKGISIHIPADGEVDLTMGQLDDFRPGKPGSEETRKILTF